MIDRLSRLLTGATLIALLVAALVAPGLASAAPLPGESCPDSTPGPGVSAVSCGEGKLGGGAGGSHGTDLDGLLPVLAATAGGVVIALGAALLVLRRRAMAPAAPADPGDWWTCRNCGRNNVIGSPRCYSCGEWQG
jgi:hypothetical protein